MYFLIFYYELFHYMHMHALKSLLVELFYRIMDPNQHPDEEAQPSAEAAIRQHRADFEEQVHRGKTIMRDLVKRRSVGKKTTLLWNDNGQTVGQSAKKLTGFIGCTVREKVPITVTDWRKVNRDKRDEIWAEIQVSYFVTIKFNFVLITL